MKPTQTKKTIDCKALATRFSHECDVRQWETSVTEEGGSVRLAFERDLGHWRADTHRIWPGALGLSRGLLVTGLRSMDGFQADRGPSVHLSSTLPHALLGGHT